MSSRTLRVLEGLPGGPMRCGETGTPEGSIEGGRILDPTAVGATLRQLLARTEITTSRALIAASDTLASFRVLSFSSSTPDSEIEAALMSQLPSAPDRLAVHRTDVPGDRPHRTIYATVWDRDQVRAIADAARHAGLEPGVVDLKSLCIARAVSIPTCIVLDMSAEPFEVVLIEDHIPRVWHSFSAVAEGDLASALATGLRPVLGFYKSSAGTDFSADAPILVRSDHAMPSPVARRLQQLTKHPVEPVPQPARIDPEVRFGPYMACAGLVLRRRT